MLHWLRQDQTLLLEGVKYTPAEIIEEWKILKDRSLYEKLPPSAAFKLDIFNFLTDWFNDSDEMTVHTSGSTGEPKPIRVSKIHMMNSAAATCNFLSLKAGDKALLCMSLSFIAGKMMVVRALMCGLNLIPVVPSGFPLKDLMEPVDFAAFVPMQVFNSLQVASEINKLKSVKTIIIGGGAVDAALEYQLKSFPNRIFSTYGMAETLSHVAMRRLNGREASEWYRPFPGVAVRLTHEGCLIIDAPKITSVKLVTNDRAEIRADQTFRLLGRIDNVINTGGIKIQIEKLEERLRDYLSVPFAITSIPDSKFGEIVVLVTEGQIDETLLNYRLHTDAFPAHEIPKRVICLSELPYTDSGKIKRSALSKHIVEICNNK